MSDTLNHLRDALGHRYAVERELGRGGMAVVYLAEDLKHKRQVALKVLRPELAATIGVDRFLREIEIAAQLTHPNILPLLDSGDAAGLLYYVMPYVEGESLHARLKRGGPLIIGEAIRVLRDVADALSHAHARGVVHRDIKPDNVLLSQRHALVADFGIGKAMSGAVSTETLTSVGVSVGTPAYMSPEQATSPKDIDHRTDIYAFGILAYEVLAGEPPFAGESAQAVVAAHLVQDPQPLAERREDVPVPLAELVMRCLEKQREDRWQSADELVQRLEAITTPSEGITPTIVLRPKGRRVIGKRWWTRIGVGAGALVGVTAVVFALPALLPKGDSAGSTLDPDRVVVATLENQTGDTSFASVGPQAADWITQGVQQRGVADAVPTTEATLDANSFRDALGGGPVSALARATGAGVVLHGAYYLVDDSLQFQIQITDAAEGRLLSAPAPVMGPKEPITNALSVLRERVLGALAATLDLRAGILMLPVEPPSLEVYRVFQRGLATDEIQWDDRALRAYQEAWEMDSTFYPALLMIEKHLRWHGRDAESDSVGRIVARYRDRMNEAEYLFSQLYKGEGPEAHLPAVRRLAELVPSFWTYAAAYAAWYAYRPREAANYFAMVDTTVFDLIPVRRDHYWLGIAQVNHMLERYEEELEAARAPRLRLIPLGALGRVEELNKELDTLFAQPVEGVSGQIRARDWRALVGADELRAHGHYDAARQVVRRTIDWIEARPEQESRQLGFGSYYTLALAECFYRLESWENARVLYEESLQNAESGRWAEYIRIQSLGRLGAIAARQGHGERAREVSAQLAEEPGGQPERRAGIAALLGEREVAVLLLNGVLRDWFDRGRWQGGWGDYVLRMHREMDLESLRDYPAFQQFMQPRDGR